MRSKNSFDWLLDDFKDVFGLSDGQIEFCDKNGIVFSTQYIGMVRCYANGGVPWQTSFSEVISSIVELRRASPFEFVGIDYENLSKQVHEFLGELMKMDEVNMRVRLYKNVGLLDN